MCSRVCQVRKKILDQRLILFKRETIFILRNFRNEIVMVFWILILNMVHGQDQNVYTPISAAFLGQYNSETTFLELTQKGFQRY